MNWARFIAPAAAGGRQSTVIDLSSIYVASSSALLNPVTGARHAKFIIKFKYSKRETERERERKKERKREGTRI